MYSHYPEQTLGLWKIKGWNVHLNTVNIKNENFTWNMNFNISFNKNKINSLKYMPIKDEVSN